MSQTLYQLGRNSKALLERSISPNYFLSFVIVTPSNWDFAA